MKLVLQSTLATLTLSTSLYAHSGKNTTPEGLWDSSRPDSHAPISVMADHTHNTGEWMFSYRYMHMHMSDLYQGDSTISPANSGYVITPTEMTMEMHMLGVMYAPSNELTLMAMTNYSRNSMNMIVNRGPLAGQTPTMESEGWGDTSVGGLYKFHDADRSRAHFGLSLSLPTGSTDETFVSPFGVADQPFPMQLGTGTFDLLPSLTYLKQPNDTWSWGAQLKGRVHLNENDEGFSYGDSISATSWAATNVTEWASLSFRLAATSWKGIQGDTNDSVNNLPPAAMRPFSSPADPHNHGGTRIDAGFGVNLLEPESGFRVAAEFVIPVYQKLSGTQLGQDWTVTLGTQYAW